MSHGPDSHCSLRECFDGAVFGTIRIFAVLNVMIERKDQLLRIVNLFRADAFEFAHYRRSVVVCAVGQSADRRFHHRQDDS